jgi:Transposase DDE domain
VGHARSAGCLAAAEDGPTRGRPRDYSDLAIETGHLLRLAFGRPWRQTEGLLRSLVGLLGVEVGIPDHTTFARRSPGLVLATALARAQAGGGPVDVVIDATGLKVHGAGEWLAETHGARGKRTWRKLHLAVDPGSGEILACELTSNEEGDASQDLGRGRRGRPRLRVTSGPSRPEQHTVAGGDAIDGR